MPLISQLDVLPTTGAAEWEAEAISVGREAGCRAFKSRINEWIESVDWPQRLADPTEPDGAPYRLHEWRERQFNTALGPISVRMPEYRKTGRPALFPVPDALGMLDSTSPQLAFHLGSLAAELSFARVATEVRDLLGVDVSATTVAKVSALAGRHAMEQQLRPEIPSTFERPQRIRVYLDGGRLRTRLKDRPWVEPRLARIELVNALGDVHTLTLSRICSAEEFWKLLQPLLVRVGAATCPQLAFFGDGAEWILYEARRRFPSAVLVLDCYHATEHVHAAAKERWGDSPIGKEWASRVSTAIQRGQISAVLIELQFADHPALVALDNYLRPRREFLRYKTFERDGWPIGSGPIEGLVKQALNLRLKRTGARWCLDSAEQVLALRCAKIFGTYPAVWRRMIEAQSAQVPQIFHTLFHPSRTIRAA